MSSMKINYNVSAMVANNSLKLNDNNLTKALERLSSGYKINSAKDDAAGLAIARRMNAQIRGLDTATQDAKDGISVVEIADGALAEVQDMLQRMNELAVKSANGTMTDDDRVVLNNEVEQLKEEITRIGQTTEFNSQKLFDGSFDLKGYVTNNNDIKVNYYSDSVAYGEHTLELPVTAGKKVSGMVDGNEDVKVTISGMADVPTSEPFTIDLEGLVTRMNETENATGKAYEIKREGTVIIDSKEYTVERTDTKALTLVCGDTTIKLTNKIPWNEVEFKKTSGDKYKLEVASCDTIDESKTAKMGDMTLDIAIDGNQLILTGDKGYEIRLNREDSWNDELSATDKLSLDLDFTGYGAMTLQIGANEGQTVDIRIPQLSLLNTGIDDLKLTTRTRALNAIGEIDSAIKYVSDMRSRLGAYQNRLEHTQSNLMASSENVTAAYSRIMDTDMATEMTNYTNLQVVSQAATSILAQANERPSQMLQLLQ